MNSNIHWRAATKLGFVDVDMDDLHIFVMAPGHHLALQSCAKPDDEINLFPQAVPDRHANTVVGF